MKKYALAIFTYLVFCGTLASAEFVTIPTSASENRNAQFYYRVPANYNKDSKCEYRVLVYFGGRNTKGTGEINNKTWTDWCDKNDIFLVVPSYKNDDYWQPQRWSGKALFEALTEIKKRYNICDDKLLYYGYSAGAQCANLFPAWKPEKSRAYVSHACGVFHKPNVTMKEVFGLLTCGDADRQRFIINHRFISEYRKQGINILWKSFPNHPHDVPKGSTYLAQSFLEYYHKLYACDLNHSASVPAPSSKILYIGDDLDGTIYPAGSPEAKNVAEDDRVYFTSEELARAWEQSAAMP